MPRWWDPARQITLFLLGVAVIVDAIVSPGSNTPILVAGLVLVGLVPLDRYLIRRSGSS